MSNFSSRQGTGLGSDRDSSMESYLGFAGLHFSPPEAGLWGLQDKEGVGHETSSRLLNLEKKTRSELCFHLPYCQ